MVLTVNGRQVGVACGTPAFATQPVIDNATAKLMVSSRRRVELTTVGGV